MEWEGGIDGIRCSALLQGSGEGKIPTFITRRMQKDCRVQRSVAIKGECPGFRLKLDQEQDGQQSMG